MNITNCIHFNIFIHDFTLYLEVTTWEVRRTLKPSETENICLVLKRLFMNSFSMKNNKSIRMFDRTKEMHAPQIVLQTLYSCPKIRHFSRIVLELGDLRTCYYSFAINPNPGVLFFLDFPCHCSPTLFSI